MNQELAQKIEEKIMKKGEISPFLFLSQNLELLNADILSFTQELLKSNSIDAQSLFHLQDMWEAIKISEIKTFLSKGDIAPRFAFQVFFIEDISRMTLQAQNACLKFFEEPGEWNIVFLSSDSQSWVLETILSRVQTVNLNTSSDDYSNSFYYSMIDSHILGTSQELVRYFFSGKYEKQEYVDFLKTIVHYIEKTSTYNHLLDELHEDIWWILKNNLQGRYVTDKYIMLLSA